MMNDKKNRVAACTDQAFSEMIIRRITEDDWISSIVKLGRTTGHTLVGPMESAIAKEAFLYRINELAGHPVHDVQKHVGRMHLEEAVSIEKILGRPISAKKLEFFSLARRTLYPNETSRYIARAILSEKKPEVLGTYHHGIL